MALDRLDSHRRHVRAAAIVVILACSLVVGHGWLTAASGGSVPTTEADEADGRTAIATQHGELLIYSADGDLAHVDDRYDTYFDIDPSPEGRDTLALTVAKRITDERCMEESACWLVGVERYNYSTGDAEMMHSRVQYRETARWHDANHVSGDTYVVADITNDAVFTVNATTDMTTWEWRASSDLPLAGGSDNPEDWVHLNDVERVEDGSYMVSLRNQDTVGFVHPQKGLLENRSLGADDDHAILYEQHDPHYIPRENGGAAVVVADSQNERVVEYQYRDGEWEQTWTWRDSRLSWPRDADRLPDGNTLITDSNGNRVIEVDENGDVVWQVTAPLPYEAERLDVGEQAGPSAEQADLASRSVQAQTPEESVTNALRAAVPNKLLNGLKFVVPYWVGMFEATALLVGGAALAGWLAIEAVLSPHTLRSLAGRVADRVR